MRWIKNENVIWEELNGGTLLVDTKNGSRWTLKSTAAAAWKLCDGTLTLGELSCLLRQKREDIAAICHEFESMGLMRRENAACSAPVFRLSASSPLILQAAGVGVGARRRPSPRGNSGPG